MASSPAAIGRKPEYPARYGVELMKYVQQAPPRTRTTLPAIHHILSLQALGKFQSLPNIRTHNRCRTRAEQEV